MLKLFLICAFFYQFPLTRQANLTEGCFDGSKLCFGIPSECASSATFTCDMLVLISATPNLKDGLNVDLYASNAVNKWYGLGFVDKKGMAGATVVHCDSSDSTGVSVGEGFTYIWGLTDLPSKTLISSSSAKLEDGLIHCQWVQKASGTAGSSGIVYDMNKPYYVQLALGNFKNNIIARHDTKTITLEPVDLKSTGIIIASNKIPLKVRIHGSCMTVAWLCLVSIATMIARYHKNSWGETTIGSVKVWFALHRGFMICAIISAISGMIAIFVHVGGWRADSPHQYLGLFANILMILQPIGALFRPHPDHENRIYFNILHFLGGSIGHTLAILALFFVLNISSVNLSTAYLWLLVSFVSLLVVTHLVLQFHPHLLATLNIIEDIPMVDPRNKPAIPSTSPSLIETLERSKKRVLTLYALLVFIITVSVLVIVNKGKPN